MSNQLTSNVEALRLFFTDDVYLVKSAFETEVEVTLSTLDRPEIVEIATTAPVISIAKVPTVLPQVDVNKEIMFEYLGKNQQGILILVNDEVNKVSTPQGTELLRKLVKAIELTNNDFALVNYANYQSAVFDDLHHFFNVKIILSFGVSTRQLGMADLSLHSLHKLGDKKMIFTANLHDLDSDPASKKMLWTSLQQLR